jgi:hypothetical protein
MKFLIFVSLFALAAAQTNRTYPIYDRVCEVRKSEMRDSVKQSFNVAAVSRIDIYFEYKLN